MSVVSTCDPFHRCLSCPHLEDPRRLPTIAAEITGSVGVRQADIVKQDMKLSEGKSSDMNPGEIGTVKRSQRGRNGRTSNDEPPNRHRRDDKHEQPSNVLLHIWPRQLDPDSEQTNGQYNSHNFKRDHPTLGCPTTGVEYVRTVRSHNHPESRADDNFADVQLRSMSMRTRSSAGVQSNTNLLSNKQRKNAELSVESVRLPFAARGGDCIPPQRNRPR